MLGLGFWEWLSYFGCFESSVFVVFVVVYFSDVVLGALLKVVSFLRVVWLVFRRVPLHEAVNLFLEGLHKLTDLSFAVPFVSGPRLFLQDRHQSLQALLVQLGQALEDHVSVGRQLFLDLVLDWAGGCRVFRPLHDDLHVEKLLEELCDVGNHLHGATVRLAVLFKTDDRLAHFALVSQLEDLDDTGRSLALRFLTCRPLVCLFSVLLVLLFDKAINTLSFLSALVWLLE